MTEWVVLELSPKAEGEDPDLIRASIRHMLRDAEIYIPASVTKVGEDRVVNYLVDGYAFIKRAHADDRYFRLEGSRYVQTVISNVGRGPNGKSIRQLACLKDADIERFRGQIHAEENQGIGVGDTVVVTSGPYRQIQATVIEDVPEKEEVQVHIKLRSKEDLVTLPRSFLRLVQRAPKSPYLERVEAHRAWFDAVKPFLGANISYERLVRVFGRFELANGLLVRRSQLEGFFRVVGASVDIRPLVTLYSRFSLLDRASRSFSFLRAVGQPAALDVSRIREQADKLGRLVGWDTQWKSSVSSYEKLHNLHKQAYSPPSYDALQGAFLAWTYREDIFERLGALRDDLDAIERDMTESSEHVDYVVVDGHNLAIRCAVVPGLDSLKDTQGRSTGAIVGFLRSLGSYRKKFPNAEIVVTWDGSSKRRKQVFPEYKANRVSASASSGSNGSGIAAAFDQIHWLREVLPYLGVRQVWNPEEEADDVIATLARKYAGKDVVIVSTDRDLLQLVRDEPHGEGHTRVRLFQPGKDRLVDAATVEAEYGVSPNHMVDLRALDGDTSDNIPGVPGFGLKTAAKLLRLYGTVEGVYKSNFAGVTATQYKKLVDAEKQVRLNLQLMALQDVPLMVVTPDPNQIVASQRLQDVDVKSGPVIAAMLGSS
jgi:5'-3' exonuclease/transcription antitermination factor NusG